MASRGTHLKSAPTKPMNGSEADCVSLSAPSGSTSVGGPIVAFVGALAGFVALGRCGYELVGASGGVASFWPATGLIVGLLVVAPTRVRPWILAALLPGELITDVLLQGYPVFTALGWGGTGTVEAVLAAWIVLRLAGGRRGGTGCGTSRRWRLLLSPRRWSERCAAIRGRRSSCSNRCLRRDGTSRGRQRREPRRSRHAALCDTRDCSSPRRRSCLTVVPERQAETNVCVG
jgi:hypothetical protein